MIWAAESHDPGDNLAGSPCRTARNRMNQETVRDLAGSRLFRGITPHLIPPRAITRLIA